MTTTEVKPRNASPPWMGAVRQWIRGVIAGVIIALVAKVGFDAEFGELLADNIAALITFIIVIGFAFIGKLARDKGWPWPFQQLAVLLAVTGILMIAAPAYAADADADGVDDGLDNCLDWHNPEQVDTDEDLIGNACDADFDQNGKVGSSDFNTFRFCWMASADGRPWDRGCDLNEDDVLTRADFRRFRSLFGGTPGPSALK